MTLGVLQNETDTATKTCMEQEKDHNSWWHLCPAIPFWLKVICNSARLTCQEKLVQRIGAIPKDQCFLPKTQTVSFSWDEYIKRINVGWRRYPCRYLDFLVLVSVPLKKKVVISQQHKIILMLISRSVGEGKISKYYMIFFFCLKSHRQ